MSERRGNERVRTFLRGQITFNHRLATMDCVVRDLSSSGARLALSQHGILPERFDLTIPHREVTYKCALRWRRPTEVGVVFEVPAETNPRPPAVDPASVDLLVRVRQLELENAELRRRIADMMTAWETEPA